MIQTDNVSDMIKIYMLSNNLSNLVFQIKGIVANMNILYSYIIYKYKY
jgi:hypothetical protein